MSNNNATTTTEQQPLQQQQHSIHRPTEAQLRWAQFHHGRRALRVQVAVQNLWQTPASINEVDGALSTDGNSSTEEEGSVCSSSSIATAELSSDTAAAFEISQQGNATAAPLDQADDEMKTTIPKNSSSSSNSMSRRRRHGKPKISRGRRALLRVSQRAYDARSLEIQRHGYGFGGGSGIDDDSRVGVGGSTPNNNNNDNDALAALFAEDYMKTKKRRIRRRTRGGRHVLGPDDQERVQRFEEAFHVMMMNLAAHIPKPVAIETPGKRWTRPPGLESMDHTFVDGREYVDLKWGVVSTATKNRSSSNNRNNFHHLPTTATTEMTTTRHDHEVQHGDDEHDNNHRIDDMENNNGSSPVRKKFCDIVNEFHQRIMHKHQPQSQPAYGPTPTMRLSKYFRPTIMDDNDDEDNDEKKDDNDDDEAATGGGVLDTCRRKLLHEDDDDAVGQIAVQERVAAFEDSTSASKAAQTAAAAAEEQLGNVLASIDPQLLSEMEQLDPGVIHRLRAFYLGESSPKHEGLVKNIKTRFEPSSSNNNGDDDKTGGGLVQRLVERMEKAVQQEHLISADGKLHKVAFAHLLNTYLLEASPANKLTKNNNNTVQQRRQQAVSSLQQPTSRKNNSELVEGYLENVGIRLENENDNSAATTLPPPPTMRFIDSFVTKMNDNCEKIVDANGNFDKHKFETIVARYLAEASGTDEATVLQADDLESLGTLQSYNKTKQQDDDEDDHKSLLSADQIHRFIQNLIQASEVDPLVSPSGKLHRATFEKLVNRYLLVTMPQSDGENFLQNARSPLALASARKSARKSMASQARNRRDSIRMVPMLHNEQDDATILSGPESPGFIKRFIDQMEQATEELCIVDSRGKLDKNVFEKLVEQHLVKATTKRSVKQDIDDGIIVNLLVQQQVPFSPEPGSKRVAHVNTPAAAAAKIGSPVPVVSPTESSFFDKLRRADPDDDDYDEPNKTDMARSVVSDLTHETGPPPLDHRADDEAQPAATGQQGDVQESSASKGLAKFGGFMKMLYKREDPSAADQSSDELRAVAAFRKIRDEHRETNGSDATNSTFQVLPDGIKKVVQNIRGNKLSPKSEEEEEDEASFATPEIPRTPGSRMSARRGSQPQMMEPSSSDDRTPSSYNASEITPERARMFHQKVMERSALIGVAAAERSIIDTDGSDASGAEMNPDVLAKLMLSPTILTKRHQQAIRAIEKRNWEQVAYLTNANPWLAEMTDYKTNQYLLHKLALYGAGEVRIDEQSGVVIRYPAAPMQVNTDIVRLFPSSVHKFDQDGNLPLHMASASANAPMVRVLGDRFPSGATVLNEDGLLPLHLAILACASPRTLAYEDPDGAVEIIQSVLNYFPGAVAVSDSEGNLPIHTAASVLRGEVGVGVIYLLLDEAEQQLSDPGGARFRNKVKVEDTEDMTVNTFPTEAPTDSIQTDDDSIPCTLILNDNFHTPLLAAIYARAGWQVIEALVQGRGGVQAARARDDQANNALHLVVSEQFKDPASALSILKVVPETASYRNEEGMLPIEIACMQMLPRQVILAMAIVDLPIDLDRKDTPQLRGDGYGGSWWYLACDTDDEYVDVVEEIISLCSFAQVREMCFMSGPGGESLITRATKKCMAVMQKSLRFLSRFEFISTTPIHSDQSHGIKMFEALDFGTDLQPFDEGRPIILKCYSTEEVFAQEIQLVGNLDLDFSLLEEISIHSVDRESSNGKQYCVAIEQAELTLQDVVSGMLDNEECQTDVGVRKRYAGKVFSVLRLVAKGLAHLHSLGVIHGCVSLEHVGKFQAKWKISEIMIIQRIGDVFHSAMFSKASPPEAIEHDNVSTTEIRAIFRSNLIVDESIDIWAFGNMAFEVLVGEPLVDSDPTKEFDEDHSRLLDIMHWGDYNLQEISHKLQLKGVSDSGINLITSCLSPDARNRPSAAEILSHPVWKELRREKG